MKFTIELLRVFKREREREQEREREREKGEKFTTKLKLSID